MEDFEGRSEWGAALISQIMGDKLGGMKVQGRNSMLTLLPAPR